MKRVFIVGAIGFDRMSDECLLSQLIHSMREGHPGVHIGVLSNKPAQTAKLGVEAVPREDVKAMWEAVEDSDTVVWLQSEHPAHWRSLGLELILVRLAKWRKKAIHSYRHRFNQQLTGWLANQANRLFDRSDEKRDIVLTTNDHSQNETLHPLLFVHRSQPDGLRRLQEEGIHLSQRPVAFCLDRQTVSAHIDDIASLADTLIDAGVALLFMPVEHFADMEAANHVQEKMKHAAPVMRKVYTAQEWIDILGGMQTVVTTYDTVRAMCKGLDVPCVSLDEDVEAFVYRQEQTFIE